jgi:chemotaxis signal transduction protein
MDALKKDNAVRDTILLFRVGSVTCCSPVADVDSVVMPTELSYLPQQDDAILGLIQYRRQSISIISLHRKFGLELPEDESAGRYIIAHVDGQLVGFWVDEVVEITDHYSPEWTTLPATSGQQVFDKTLLWQDRICLHSDFARLSSMAGSNVAAWLDADTQGCLQPLTAINDDVDPKRIPRRCR